MVDATFTTQNSLVFTWTLPILGSKSDITVSMFTVTWRRQGCLPNTTTIPFTGGRTSHQEFAIAGLLPGMVYDVWVIANYFIPLLDSDPAMTTGTTLPAGQGEYRAGGHRNLNYLVAFIFHIDIAIVLDQKKYTPNCYVLHAGLNTPASSGLTVGLSIAIAVTLVTAVIVIVTLVIFLIVRTRQLQEAR